MAVVIGTQLRKELSGGLLFDDVSFKVERRERLALSGPNGAGKTTLLRMLAGETGYDAGKIVFDKGTRIALHDQRPPLDLGLSLREYALSGARDLIDLEEELRRLEAAMAAGDHGQETLSRYSTAQARLEHAGGYAWRENSLSTLRGLGFEDVAARPAALDVLRRRADARVVGAVAGRRSRPAAPGRADEPSGRRAARVARADARRTRRSGDPRRPRPLVPRGGDDRGARARGWTVDLLPGPVARVAAREGRACARRVEVDRALQRRHRAAAAVRRPLPVQEVEGEAGAGEAHAHRAAEEGEGGRLRRALAAHPPREAARLRVPEPAAQREDGRRGR